MTAEETGPAAVARALVGGGLGLRRGEHLLVVSWNHTLPWAGAVVAEARRVGAAPTLLLEDEPTFWRSLEVAPSAKVWARGSRPARRALEGADAVLYFPGPADRPRFRALPPSTQSPFLGSEDEWLRRLRLARARGIRCLLGYASDEQSVHWGVSGATWRNQIARGIAEADTAEIARHAARASRLLTRGRSVRITADNGTDLTVGLRGRAPWVDDGRVDAEDRRRGRAVATAPAGTVVVAIDETSARGLAVANRPSYLSHGRVDGGQWEVDGGKLRNYWYTGGGAAFDAEFTAAPRGREVVALLGLGLNRALAPGVPHAEDEEAGAVTLAIGGNTLYGGRNRCRFLSWITVGEATVAVDGAPLVDRGQIL